MATRTVLCALHQHVMVPCYQKTNELNQNLILSAGIPAVQGSNHRTYKNILSFDNVIDTDDCVPRSHETQCLSLKVVSFVKINMYNLHNTYLENK